jgi:hypothetical protein
MGRRSGRIGGMKILQVDHRLWIAIALLLLCSIALKSWTLTQRPNGPSQQMIELREEADQKLSDFQKARDEYDQQFDAAVNGNLDDLDTIYKTRERLSPLWERVLRLRDDYYDAAEKAGQHINR